MVLCMFMDMDIKKIDSKATAYLILNCKHRTKANKDFTVALLLHAH